MSNWSKSDVDLANARRQKSPPPGEQPKPSKADVIAEKEMHRVFSQWLRLNNVGFIEARMDKKSELPKGHPDFTVFANGRIAFIEFKSGGNTLSYDQAYEINKLLLMDNPVLVSRDVGEAIAWTRERLFQ